MKQITYFIYIQATSSFEILKETQIDESQYKGTIKDSEESCWNECKNELACNSVSFYNNSNESLYSDSNCFLYTNKVPKTFKSKNFVSKVSKKQSNFHFNFI